MRLDVCKMEAVLLWICEDTQVLILPVDYNLCHTHSSRWDGPGRVLLKRCVGWGAALNPYSQRRTSPRRLLSTCPFSYLHIHCPSLAFPLTHTPSVLSGALLACRSTHTPTRSHPVSWLQFNYTDRCRFSQDSQSEMTISPSPPI